MNRLLATFVDVGTSITISGTGFWLESTPEKKKLFVTNRHNVDPRLHRDLVHAKTARVAIELRTDPDDEHVDVQQFEVVDMGRSLFVAEDADCAVFIEPRLDGFAPPFEISTMASEHHLAYDGHDVWRWLDIGDATTFIGFAGTGTSSWWDRKRSYPIGRPAALASFPGKPFEHDDIKTADTALVSGLSFSGASGSPVISHVKVDVSDDFSAAHFENRVDSAHPRHHVGTLLGARRACARALPALWALVLHARAFDRRPHRASARGWLRQHFTAPIPRSGVSSVVCERGKQSGAAADAG